MRIGLYYCPCGMDDLEGAPGPLDVDALEGLVADDFAYIERIDFACSADGRDKLERHLEEARPDRVVITVCSVRDHEETFRAVLRRAGLNPFGLQLVNVREHVAWVTEGTTAATAKAAAYLRAAARRVRLQPPLEEHQLDVNTGCLVIGGGPAGVRAAITLAEAGRHVTLVEAGPVIGGLPVRVEELFPRLECGPCMLDPFLGAVLHGPTAQNIELLLLSEVVSLKGLVGNFTATIRQRPRYVAVDSCIGCGACIEACPVEMPSRVNRGRTNRKAIDLEFFGGLPNVPFIEPEACLHFGEGRCTACADCCPVENTVRLDDQERTLERQAGAIVVAIGSDLYDCGRLPGLGWGPLPDVHDSYEFERLLAQSGPTEGVIATRDGRTPQAVALIHCADDTSYSAGICCMNGFKYDRQIAHRLPETRITHFFKMLAATGKDGMALYRQCAEHPLTEFVPFDDIGKVQVAALPSGRLSVTAGATRQEVDMVVLLQPQVASAGARALADILGIPLDSSGFFAEAHERTDSVRSPVRGIFLAGACQGPRDIEASMTHGLAAAAHALSTLVEGRKLTVSPLVAEVDEARCSACRTCVPLCPYKAIEFDEGAAVARINAPLCPGCGTCAAACPAGAITAHQFTDEQILAEVEALLR